MNQDHYEMLEVHRVLLSRSRKYLLHNVRPTEDFWADLLAKDLFPQDMIDEIRSHQTISERLGSLLDLLPARGPSAFDMFCEVLLECGHSHVAEYLKNAEATDTFRKEIQVHCSDGHPYMVDKFVQIFKHNAPTMQRLAERKFQLILEEQENDLQQKENEIKDMENKNMMLELEVSQMRGHLNSCAEICEAIAMEVEREFISKTFIREEKKHVKKLKETSEGIKSFATVNAFYGHMLTVLEYLNKHSGLQSSQQITDLNANLEESMRGSSLTDQLNHISVGLTSLIEEVCSRHHLSVSAMRVGLEKVLHQVKDMSQDITTITMALHNTVSQKNKLENEALSMLHDLQELRRLERELGEKQSHITELNRNKQLLLKKSRQHKRQLEQLYANIKEKKAQMAQIQQTRDGHLSSADQHARMLLKLLPDLHMSESMQRMDSALSGDSRSNLGTPMNSSIALGSTFGAGDSSIKLKPYTSKVPLDSDNNTTDTEHGTMNSSRSPRLKKDDPKSQDTKSRNQNVAGTVKGTAVIKGADSKSANQQRTDVDGNKDRTQSNSPNNSNKVVKSDTIRTPRVPVTRPKMAKPKVPTGAKPGNAVVEETQEPIVRQTSFEKKMSLLDQWYKEYTENQKKLKPNEKKDGETKADSSVSASGAHSSKTESKGESGQSGTQSSSYPSTKSARGNKSVSKVLPRREQRDPLVAIKMDPYQEPTTESGSTSSRKQNQPPSASSSENHSSGSSRVGEAEVMELPNDLRNSSVRQSKESFNNGLPSVPKQNNRTVLQARKINFFLNG